MTLPEPRLTPPEEPFMLASCGHEIYEYEELFERENGKTLCRDCLEDTFNALSLSARAELLGLKHRQAFPKRVGPYDV